MNSLIAVLAVTSANLYTVTDNWSNMTLKQRRAYCNSRRWPRDIGLPEFCNEFRGTDLDGQLLLFSQASNYGCWCDLNDALRRKGSGQPVNALDQACMDLHHGYNCITIDDGSCNPRTLDSTLGEYELPLTVISPLLDFRQECLNANQGNTCGYRTCLVEAQFLITTYQPVYAGDQAWVDMWNDNSLVHQPDGGFDYDNECPAGQAPLGGGDKECCGQYPYRRPFITSRAVCCADSVQPIGTC